MYFNDSSEDVISKFKTNPTTGLTTTQVEEMKAKYGLNKLASKKRKTKVQLFFAQLNDILIYILIVAAILSVVVGKEFSDAIIIGIVILVNATVGMIQESKAEKALDALKELSTPKAIVKRNGELVELASEEVVPGDIIVIDAGRFIPCDIRLIESANLKVEESALTGESVPVDKNATLVIQDEKVSLGDKKNMAFMSTLATYGRGIGVAVA
ncbi:MAG: HAD-IC family P-type ATPase, partial [Clostridium sp.]